MTQKTIGILGGGISGLSTAYYLRKRFGDLVRPIILEANPRCGGWMKTVTRTDGGESINYELGPRTIRPVGLSGMNTLDLVEDIGLVNHVLYVKKDHPAAKNRFIYHNEKLVKLPSDLSALFKKVEPFDKPLVYAAFRDLFKWRKKTEDDSIYQFVQRRFGSDIAQYLIDPVIRGVCAGDSRKISVKLLMKTLFQYEQKYGSALLGVALNHFKKTPLSEEESQVGFSKIALASLTDNWAVWSLEGGLQTLPYQIEANLKENKVEIYKNCIVKSIKLGDRAKPEDHVEIEYSKNDKPETLNCNHVISTIPTAELGKILRRSKPSHPSLWKVFETMESTDVQVTNLMYNNPELLEHQAFGFLVPSGEKSVPQGMLGVVFDTCSFPQKDKTILTVMSNPNVDNTLHPLKTIVDFIEKTLKIKTPPDDYYQEVLTNCIPQYTIGHYEKVDAVRRFIKAAKLPISFAGASFDGISVNDSIYSAKTAVAALDKNK